MKKEPIYFWDKDLGYAEVQIFYKNLKLTGIAECHPDDRDMMSQMMGLTIAEIRATLAYLRHIRDNELKPQLKALYQLYYSVNQSDQYEENNYHVIMLKRQISNTEEDLKNIRKQISNLKESLFRYMREKAELHQHLREKRAKGQEGLITQ